MNKITSILFCVLCAIGLSVQAQNPDPLILKKSLGIRTNVPQQPLHVNGNARIEGSTTIRGYLGLGTNNYQANGLTIWHDSPSVFLWDRDTNIWWNLMNYYGDFFLKAGDMAVGNSTDVFKVQTNGDIIAVNGRYVGSGAGLTNLNWIWRTNSGNIQYSNGVVAVNINSGNGANDSAMVRVAPLDLSSYLYLQSWVGRPPVIAYSSGTSPNILNFSTISGGFTNAMLSDSNFIIGGHMNAKSFSGDGSLVTNIALNLGPTNAVLTGSSSNNATANTFRGDVAITNLVAYGHKSDLTAIVYGVDTLASGTYTKSSFSQCSYEYNQGGTNMIYITAPNGPNTNYWRLGSGASGCPDLDTIFATNTTATLDDNTWTNVSDGNQAFVWIPQDKPSVAAAGDVIVNRFLGVGTNNPISPNSVATFRADGGGYTEIWGDNNLEPTIILTSSYGAMVAIGSSNSTGGLGYIATDNGYFDYLADYSADDSVTDIDVGFHVLTDSEGSLPLWTVLGSMIVTNSIIATNAYGTNEISLPYANYSCSTDQLVTNVATTNIVIFTDVDSANRITPLTDPGTWSKTYIQEAGAYQIIVSAIADSSGSTAPNIHMTLWLAVNGVIGGGGSVPRSATTVAIPDANSEHTLVVAFNYVFAQGDYFELWYSGEDADMLFNATAAGGTPVKPASPSVIMTVNKISSVP